MDDSIFRLTSGFVAGVALLSAISHWRARPRDITATWPDDDNKKAMKMLAPWVTKARVGKLGPFAVFVPSNPSQKNRGNDVSNEKKLS